MAERPLHPIRAEVALWHDGRLSLLAQVRQKTPTAEDMYVHLPKGDREVSYSFHASGALNQKFIENGQERLRMPYHRIIQGEQKRKRSRSDSPGESPGVAEHSLIGIDESDFPYLHPCAARPESIFIWDTDVEVAMLGFFEMGTSVNHIPFPSEDMTMIPVQAAPPKLYALMVYGGEAMADFYDGMARRLDFPPFDKPPKRPGLIQMAPDQLMPCISWPDDERPGVSTGLGHRDFEFPSGLMAAWQELPLRTGTCMDDLRVKGAEA